MEHKTLQLRLYEFLDGELSVEEAQVFSQHLASCQECQKEADAWKTAAQTLLNQPKLLVPVGFSQRVMSRIFESPEKESASLLVLLMDFLALPRWEMVTTLSVSILVFSYFSVYYFKQDQTAASPIVWVDSELEAGPLQFLGKEIGKEDLAQMTIGNADSDESDLEVSSHE